MDVKLKSYKKDFEYSYSFGVFPTLELLDRRPDEVIKVLIASNTSESHGVKKIRDICLTKGIEVDVNDKAIERISPKENSHAVGVFKKYTMKLEEGKNHVVLVNPSDMGNLGTIIRTMLGFGIQNLAIVKPAADIFDPRVVRSSMGAVFKLNFEHFDNFNDYMKLYKNDIYTFMLKADISIHDVDIAPEKPFSIVFGNEGSGLPDEFLSYGTSVIIPHSSQIDSLNLSVAVGIAHYEFTKKMFKR